MDTTAAVDGDQPDAEPMAEAGTEADQHVAGSRSTGGVEGDEVDQASTTGTTETPEFVGRVAGDDVGYAEETGAERRAEG